MMVTSKPMITATNVSSAQFVEMGYKSLKSLVMMVIYSLLMGALLHVSVVVMGSRLPIQYSSP